MQARRFSTRGISLAICAGTIWLLTAGGCPTAQQPQQQTNTDTTTTNDGGSTTTPPATDDRPIQPPGGTDANAGSGTGGTNGGTNGGTTGGTNGGSSGGSSGGAGGNGGGGSTGSVFVSVTSPGNAVGVRPGTNVNVVFDLINVAGALSKAELVIAKDDDSNGTADGAPVVANQITTVEHSNTVVFNTNTPAFLAQLQNGFGRFVFGIRTTTIAGVVATAYASGVVTVDNAIPTGAWVEPAGDNLKNRDESITVRVTTSDNAKHTVSVTLDDDQILNNGSSEVQLVAPTQFDAGSGTRTFTVPLAGLSVIRNRNYFYQVTIQDAVVPPVTFLARTAANVPIKIQITNRIVGTLNLASLDNSVNGAVLQGFNFNDLAGSSMISVPDLNADGKDELMIGSRFGKAYLIEHSGTGFGEAYLIYGSNTRLRGVKRLNSVGPNAPGRISGLIFPGIRTPKADTTNTAPPGTPNPTTWSTGWTKGLSDIGVIPDMDGDGLPELVFSFPRVESISLGETTPNIQHPELVPDLPQMGAMEFNAFDPMAGWQPNLAQFTRGGIVIVSSHDAMLTDPNKLSRKSNRTLDLHEAGQLFNFMGRPFLLPYIAQAVQRNPPTVCADCDNMPPSGCNPGTPAGPGGMPAAMPGTCGNDSCMENFTPLDDGKEKVINRWVVVWDCVLWNFAPSLVPGNVDPGTSWERQGPGGFHQPWTLPPADPPLANAEAFPFTPMTPFPFTFYQDHWVSTNACTFQNGCEVTNVWGVWTAGPGGTYPCTSLMGVPSWGTEGNPGTIVPTCYPDHVCPIVVPPAPPAMPCTTNFDETADPPGPAGPSCPDMPNDAAAGGATIWTGFYGPSSLPKFATTTGEVLDLPVGARVLGQKVNDEFGSFVGADGTWLMISAPERTANDTPYDTDVPSLSGQRQKSGVVYQLRTNSPLTPGSPTRTQLWIEPETIVTPGPNPGDPPTVTERAWPRVDKEITNRIDYTMPVPHNYIIESVGSLRGNPNQTREDHNFPTPGCIPGFNPTSLLAPPPTAVDSPVASDCLGYTPYPVGTAGYDVDRVPQIIGPHVDARISYVRALGDVNDDGIRDFAIGSEHVKADVSGGTGAEVGAVFIVYGRPTGVEGDYLLEQLALDPSDPQRLNGVLLRGTNTGEKLARVVDDAGDVNGDGVADVIVGNEGKNGNAGEAIVLLGSPSLLSPAGGWTAAQAVASGNAIRFFSVVAGELAGANVAGIGDVDGDGFGDLLIASPGAGGNKGQVYLIYGSAALTGDFDLAKVGTVDLPGAKLIGRNVGDFAGGTPTTGKVVTNTDPVGGSTQCFSRGVARLGDIDGDGKTDYAISSMLASPGGKTNAGEVYILYGRGD